MDALVSWPLAQKLGAILEGLPKFFCSKVRVSDDKTWTEEEGKFSEKPLLDKVRERIKEGVRKSFGGQCKAPEELMLQTQGL